MMLTGRGDGAAIEAAYRAGATDFVTKPINPVLLGHRAKYVLRAAATLEEVERHRASLANAERLARLGSWSWRQRSSRFEFSDQYREITGDSGESTGMPFERRLASVHPEDRERVRQAYSRVTGAAEPCSVVFRLRQDGSDGPLVHEQVEIVRDVSGAILRYEGAIQDITERVATEERIRQLADYDGLTRLANRRLFVEVMRNGLAQARRRGVSAAVLDINLDRFKRINETLGDASSGPQASTESTGDRTASPRQAGVSTGSMAPNQRTRISSSRTRSKGLVG
jgi:PAS domain S-box-containing protein